MKQQQGSEACDVARDLAKNTQYDIHPHAGMFPQMTQNKSESKGMIRKGSTVSYFNTQRVRFLLI